MEDKSETEYYTSKRQMFIALGIAKTTMDVWIEKPWFPKKHAKGWLKSEVHDAVDEYEASKEPGGPITPGTREEKTSLECKRLKIVIEKERENLAQAQEETRRQIEEGKRATRKLIDKAEVTRGLDSLFSELRSVIESWGKSCEADDPDNHEKYKRAVKLYLDKVNEELSEIGK